MVFTHHTAHAPPHVRRRAQRDRHDAARHCAVISARSREFDSSHVFAAVASSAVSAHAQPQQPATLISNTSKELGQRSAIGKAKANSERHGVHFVPRVL